MWKKKLTNIYNRRQNKNIPSLEENINKKSQENIKKMEGNQDFWRTDTKKLD